MKKVEIEKTLIYRFNLSRPAGRRKKDGGRRILSSLFTGVVVENEEFIFSTFYLLLLLLVKGNENISIHLNSSHRDEMNLRMVNKERSGCVC